MTHRIREQTIRQLVDVSTNNSLNYYKNKRLEM